MFYIYSENVGVAHKICPLPYRYDISKLIMALESSLQQQILKVQLQLILHK